MRSQLLKLSAFATLSATVLTATIGLFESPVEALTLTSSSAEWTASDADPPLNTNEIRWGTDLGSGQSGLRFDGVGLTNFNSGEIFKVGTLTHFNAVTADGTGASFANLDLTLDFGDPATSQEVELGFGIFDSPDSSFCFFGTPPCPDIISLATSNSSSFEVGNRDFTLELIGFADTPDGNFIEDLFTPEDGSSSTMLFARLTETTTGTPGTTTPEPTATIGTLSLIGLYLASRRRKDREN